MEQLQLLDKKRIMKKKSLILTSLLFLGFVTNAQQIALNSQYMFNDFIINPAVAGTKNYAPLSFSFRRQWMGMDDAPVTQNLSLHSYIGKNTGAGAYFYNDVAGPTRRTGFSGAFSYQFQTGSSSKLSLGLSASVTQFVLDQNKLHTEIPGDVAIINSTNNQLIRDFNFGAYWYGERFHVGLTAFNLMESKNDLFDLTTPVTNVLNRAFYLTGGYTFDAGENFKVEPSLLFRYMIDALYQVDFNLRGIYKDHYWLGASYRLEDALSMMLGADLDVFTIGYSYDLTMSRLATYNSGTHEVFLSVKINKGAKNKTPWHKRNRIYSTPSL